MAVRAAAMNQVLREASAITLDYLWLWICNYLVISKQPIVS